MQQFNSNKKVIIIDQRAKKEINKFPKIIRKEFRSALETLRQIGYLEGPTGKRISSGLFEIRISHQGQFRSIYVYLTDPKLVILSAFQKKTNKTPLKEIKKAKQRLKTYLN
jgi:phage-related protein